MGRGRKRTTLKMKRRTSQVKKKARLKAKISASKNAK